MADDAIKVSTQTPPPQGGPARTQTQPASSGVSAGQYQMVTDSIGGTLSPGGMRGIGLVVFMLAQIALKLETVDLSEDYYKTNKRDFDFFKATHQPGMAATANEVMNPATNPYYETDLYASAPAGMAASKIVDKAWFATRRRMSKYNTGAHSKVDYEFALLRTAAIASGWNMGRRYEMAWADAHNERAFNRKVAMANVGIGAGNTMRQGLATAVSSMKEAYSTLGSTVATIGNGYFEKAGYDDGRSMTRRRYGEVTKEFTK